MADYYGVQRSEAYLQHYGVRGMKWGVKKYLDEKGNLSGKASSRYGKNAYKKASPWRMQRDSNMTNQILADMNAEKKEAANRLEYYKKKAAKKSDKYMKHHPLSTVKEANDHAMKKYSKKIDNYKNVYSTAEQFSKGAKNLQNRILNKAKQNNYSVTKKDATWYGRSTPDKRGQMASYYTLGLPGMLAYSATIMGDKTNNYKAPTYKFKRQK